MSLVEVAINDTESKKIAIPSFIGKLNVICYNCGKKFQTYPSYIKRKKTSRFFCSRNCFNTISNKRKPKINYWTKEEEAFIIENYLILTDIEIGKEIQRTKMSVLHRRKKLKLSKVGYLRLENVGEKYGN